MDEVHNGEFSLKQRLDVIKSFCFQSNIKQISCNENISSPFIDFEIEYEKTVFHLFLYLKNIVNSGWSDKPHIKRIQIKSFLGVDIPQNKGNCLSMLVGLSMCKDKPMIAVWNPFLFTFHKSNRSGYLLAEDIFLASRIGFMKTVCSDKTVLLCDSLHFSELIRQYISDNYLE